MTPHKTWIEQCQAARGIENEFGTQKALAYLIGEKSINFLEAAEDDVEFRADIPAFVAEIKTIFEPWQLGNRQDRDGILDSEDGDRDRQKDRCATEASDARQNCCDESPDEQQN